MQATPSPHISFTRIPFRDWACLHYTLLWAYEGGIPEHARTQTVTDPDTACWLLRKGTVRVTTDSKTVQAHAGDWVFVASPTRRQQFSDDAQILSLHFNFSWPGGGGVIDRRENLVFPGASVPGLEKTALQLIRQLESSFPTAGAYLPAAPSTLDGFLRVQNRLPLWLAEYLKALGQQGVYPRRLGAHDDRVMRGMSLLERHPLSEPFSETRLLEEIGLGRSQFHALFVKAYGLTPKAHYTRRRLEEARKLLSHTDLSVKEIGFQLGFRHASHFSLWFKKETGHTCSRYRRRCF